ncbi:hypothetical protein [Nostoc linckia]|nr:hypothetical protein [Nostoc linckia]
MATVIVEKFGEVDYLPIIVLAIYQNRTSFASIFCLAAIFLGIDRERDSD